MPDNSTDNGNAQGGEGANTSTVNTSDATAQNTGAIQTGAGTDTAQQTQAQTEKTFTQADVDRMFQSRLKSAVKAELKKLTGENDNTPTVDDLQRQLSERDQKLRSYEARALVSDYLTDARHKLNVRPENIKAIEKLVIPDLEYDDEGKPTNLKEAVESVKSLAPTLFANTPGSINANEGRSQSAVVGQGMNGLIRQIHAGRYNSGN
jgi:hypothetical protein